MKVEQLNQWLTLVANVGVIAGIIFLAYELRQNTLATELIAAQNYLAGTTDLSRIIVENADIAELVAKDTVSSVSPDRMRLNNFYAARLRIWQNAHYQFTRSALDEEIWEAFSETNIGMLAGNPAFRELWESRQDRTTSEFNDYVRAALAEVERR